MQELIRYEFLKEWVINATVDEIVEKLIELDNLKKENENGRLKKTN